MTGRNVEFPIYYYDKQQSTELPYHNLVLRKATLESVVMSLGDKLTGDVYYIDNSLEHDTECYVYVDGVKYVCVNPPTILREGMVSDNSDLNGMTKYSFVFYHPMYTLGNYPFTDIAVTQQEGKYLSQNKTFAWIGNLFDFIAKLNANLEGTQWVVGYSFEHFEPDGITETSQWQTASTVSKEVFTFDNNFISDALKKAYEEWEIPYVVEPINENGKKFKVSFGLPHQEIVNTNGQNFIFKFGQGVGLKNNSRTPKNNKIVTRIVGCGSENNIPFGYPQIVWTGDVDDSRLKYPIYKGIVGGQYVNLIKHPFTRKTLMPSVYVDCVNKKVNPNATGYDPDTVIIDYYDADGSYPNPCDASNPSVEIHKFEDIKPELGEARIIDAKPYSNVTANPLQNAIALDEFLAQINTDLETQGKVTNENERTALGVLYSNLDNDEGERHFKNQGGSYTFTCDVTCDTYYYYVKYVSDNINYDVVCLKTGAVPVAVWDDTMDDNGKYVQLYFNITLPTLDFDLYACASITEKMDINMRSGACIGCTFPIMVDWEDYKRNFYNADGEFDPTGERRNYKKYPDTSQGQVTLIVQKDLDTFGTLMPNVYQQPHANDTFVILGISLPTSYITNAEARLDSAMREYMLENNEHHFEYPLKFDEYFLAQNTNILNQIHNNCIIRFEYQGNMNALYVKQMVIKYGDKVLPQYDITLTDDIEIVLNQIGQVTDDVSRMRVQLNEVQKYYSQNLIDAIKQKLSKVEDDIAQGRITFQQGLTAIGNAIFADEIKSANFSTGLYTGQGWRVDNLGNAEFESIRARSFLEVVELLVNRMKAQEGDTMFTDNDQIDKVEEVTIGGETSYILSLKQKYGGYITSQDVGNIIKGTINTLAAKQAGVSDYEGQAVDVDGHNSYYTSWMKVTEVGGAEESDLAANQIRVSLYSDNETPAQRNFKPCELMTIARWGCYLNPNDPEDAPDEATKQSIIRRQQMFYISTSDGRIAKMTGVNKPILEEWNYGTTLGTLPDFVRNWSIGSRLIDGRDYLYAQGIVVSDFIKVDAVGQPIVSIVDCGEWVDGANMPIDPETGEPYEPTPQHGIYYLNQYNSLTMQWETHDVWHNGQRWRCTGSQPVISNEEVEGKLVEKITYHEPKWNSIYWTLIEGDSEYSLDFQSSNGWSFRSAYVNTTITPKVYFGTTDISEDFLDFQLWNWKRCEEQNWHDGNPEYTEADEEWNNDHTHKRELELSNDDMPATWSRTNRIFFICECTVMDGKETIYVNRLIKA